MKKLLPALLAVLFFSLTSPVFSQQINVSELIGEKTYCRYDRIIHEIRVSGTNISDYMAIDPSTGLEVSTDGNTYKSLAFLYPEDGVIPEQTIYVRVNPTNSNSLIYGEVEFTSAGAESRSVLVDLIRHLSPATDFSPAMYIHGDVVPEMTLKPVNGGPAQINWTANNTSIGIPAAGSGVIPSFTAVNTGTETVEVTVETETVSTPYAFVPDGGRHVMAVNLSTGEVEEHIMVGYNPTGIYVDKTGNKAYVTNERMNTVSVINTASREVIGSYNVGASPVAVAVDPQNRFIATANYGGSSVTMVDLEPERVYADIEVKGLASAIALSPSGNRAYVSNGLSTVSVIDTDRRAVIAHIEVGEIPNGLAVTPDGSEVYVANNALFDNTVSVIDAGTNTVKATIPAGENPYAVAISPDGRKAFVSNYNSHTVSVLDTETHSVIATVPVGEYPAGISAAVEGQYVYVACEGTGELVRIHTDTYATESTSGFYPVSAIGNFLTPVKNCPASNNSFIIRVNPYVPPVPELTLSEVSGSIFACEGEASYYPDVQEMSLAVQDVAEPVTIMASQGFQVSASKGSDYSPTLTITPQSRTIESTTIYVRSTGQLSAGDHSGSVQITVPDLGDTTVAVSATIYGYSEMNPVSNRSFRSGQVTEPIVFSGTASHFYWENDNPLIGLPSSGWGTIPSFSVNNDPDVALTANLSVRPVNGKRLIYMFDRSFIKPSDPETMDFGPYASAYGYDLAISANHRWAYLYKSGSIKMLGNKDLKLIREIEPEIIVSKVAVTAEHLIISNYKRQLQYLDANTLEVVNYVSLPVQWTNWVVNEQTGMVYYYAQGSDNIYVVSPESDAVDVINTRGNVSGLELSPDGSVMYILTSDGYRTLDITSGNLTSFTLADATGLMYNEGLDELYVTHSDKGISIMDGTTGELKETLSHVYTTRKPLLASNGRYLILFEEEQFAVLDLATRQIIAKREGDGLYDAYLSDDTHTLYIHRVYDHKMARFDLNTFEETHTIFPGDRGKIYVRDFILAEGDCKGTAEQFSITTNPTSLRVNRSAIPPVDYYANMAARVDSFMVSGRSLTGPVTIQAPEGFEIATSVTGPYSPALTLEAGHTNGQGKWVYTRQVSVSEAGYYSGYITISSPGTETKTVWTGSRVHLQNTMDALPDITLVGGLPTEEINFTGEGGNRYYTYRTGTDIGMPQNGFHKIPSFIPVNTTGTPITTEVTVDFSSEELIYGPGEGMIYMTRSDLTGTMDSLAITGEGTRSVFASPDGRRVYVVNYLSDNVDVIDAVNNSLIGTVAVMDEPMSIAVTPDSKKIYVGNFKSGTISVIDAATLQVIEVIPDMPYVNQLAIGPRGDKLFVWRSLDDAVVLSTEDHTQIGQLFYSKTPSTTLFSPDGSYLYMNRAERINVFDTETYGLVASIPLPSIGSFGMALSSDGSKLYAGSRYKLYVVDTQSLQIINGDEPPFEYSLARMGMTHDDSALVALTSRPGVGRFEKIDLNDTHGDHATRFDNLLGISMRTYQMMAYGGYGSGSRTFTITVLPEVSISVDASEGSATRCISDNSTANLQTIRLSGGKFTSPVSLATSEQYFTFSSEPDGNFSPSLELLPDAEGMIRDQLVYIRLADNSPAGPHKADLNFTYLNTQFESYAISAHIYRSPAMVAELPAGKVDEPFSTSLTIAAFHNVYEVTTSGLPEGLAVDASGNISGTPVSAGAYEVEVTLYTAGACPVTEYYTLNINRAQAEIIQTNIVYTYDGDPKEVTLITEPRGLRVNVVYYDENGLMDTAPVNGGRYNFTATVEDPDYEGVLSDDMLIVEALQTLTLTEIDTQYLESRFVRMTYTADTDNEVRYRVYGPAYMSADTVFFTGEGTVGVQASMSGTQNYLPAYDSISFYVADVPVLQGTDSYPNPASDDLYIKLPISAKPYTVTLIDVMGNQVMAYTMNRSDKIDVSALPEGIYTLIITDGDSSKTIRILIE